MGAFSDAWDVFMAADRATVDVMKNLTLDPGARRKLERARDDAWNAVVSCALVPGDPMDARAMREMETYPPSRSPVS
jgi:hypothetical protein